MIIDQVKYSLIDKSSEHLVLEIDFSKTCSLFEGHFQDLPLLPGVVQIHLAVRLYEKEQQCNFIFDGMKSTKFFSPIFPDTVARLECRYQDANSQFSFEYSRDGKVFSRGTVMVKHG